MSKPKIHCECAPDADHHMYDMWGEYDVEDSSLEGSGDDDDY